MRAAKVDRCSEKDLARYFRNLLSHYEDDLDDFIEPVVTQDEIWVQHFDPLGLAVKIAEQTMGAPWLTFS